MMNDNKQTKQRQIIINKFLLSLLLSFLLFSVLRAFVFVLCGFILILRLFLVCFVSRFFVSLFCVFCCLLLLFWFFWLSLLLFVCFLYVCFCFVCVFGYF